MYLHYFKYSEAVVERDGANKEQKSKRGMKASGKKYKGKQKRKRGCSEADDADVQDRAKRENSSEVKNPEKRTKQQQRPNYFVSIQITDPQVCHT